MRQEEEGEEVEPDYTHRDRFLNSKAVPLHMPIYKSAPQTPNVPE
jgi:hypothetical protein